MVAYVRSESKLGIEICNMRTNKLKKPTLVQKSENNTLVLKSEIPVKTVLVKNISSHHQSLYTDKTK